MGVNPLSFVYGIREDLSPGNLNRWQLVVLACGRRTSVRNFGNFRSGTLENPSTNERTGGNS
jgi:hypothetical protein